MGSKQFICFTILMTCGCSTIPQNCESEAKSAKSIFDWAPLPENKEGEDKESQEPEDDSPRSKPLESDRPDFTEASSTVGRGVFQFEGGYTYTRNRAANITSTSHSYPQALFRIGMFADWFELRVGQNYAKNQATGTVDEPINGFEDTYLGVKLALTEQKQFLPEMALILQSTIPTGQDQLSNNLTLPGINFLYGWDVIKDKIDMGGSLLANKSVESDGHAYLELANSFTIGYTLTEKLGAFTECYAFFPSGAISPDIKPQYYFDGGFIYQLTYNIQFDVNAGIGLNRYADNFFVGTGIVLRY